MSSFPQPQVWSIFNQSYTANANFLFQNQVTSSFSIQNLTPINAHATFRMYICMSASGVLSVVRTQSTASGGSGSVKEQMNSGTALTANASYMFDFPAGIADTINIQYSVSGTILKCQIKEIGIGTA